MECFLILRLTSRNTEAVFEVVDRFFHIHTDFVGGIPLFCAADRARVSTEIFLWIDINHSSAGRSCARVITVTGAAFRFVCFVVFPFHFGTDKFHGWKAAA